MENPHVRVGDEQAIHRQKIITNAFHHSWAPITLWIWK